MTQQGEAEQFAATQSPLQLPFLRKPLVVVGRSHMLSNEVDLVLNSRRVVYELFELEEWTSQMLILHYCLQ